MPAHGGWSNPSGATISDFDPAAGNNHGHLALTFRESEHIRHPIRVAFDIDIGVILVGLPGPLGIGSPIFTVDNGRFVHTPSSWGLVLRKHVMDIRRVRALR
jgi:hypothetical protein